MLKGQAERLERLSRWNDYLSLIVGFFALILGPIILVRALLEGARPLYVVTGLLFLALGLYRAHQYRQYRRRR